METTGTTETTKTTKTTTEPKWAVFERHSITEHARLHPTHETFAWQHTPEELLFDAGFIHSFNERRMARLLAKKAHGCTELTPLNPLQDTGFDGIARDSLGVIHGLQAKAYTKRIAASDLGSSLAKTMLLRMKMPDSKLFLYTLQGVTRDLEEVIAGTGQIVHTKLEEPRHSIVMNEYDVMLRPHQQDAVAALIKALETNEDDENEEDEEDDKDDENENDEDEKEEKDDENKRYRRMLLLHMPCGTGKTLVTAHVLRHISFSSRCIVVAAPLKTLVEQLRSRLLPFLPDHASILVDSDGTTDAERVKLFLAANQRSVVFTTFDSAVGVLSCLRPDKQDVLVLDEAHNAHGNEALASWSRQFERGLVLTATPQDDLDEILDCVHGFELSFREAIDQHLLCDYSLWFPLASDLTDNEPLDIELAELPRDLALKALFLIRGMLQTGARRTFAYLTTQEEAREFACVFAQVADKFHGISTWTGTILSDTTQCERAALFQQFRNDDKSGVLCVLASVRILDEGIDEPACDSTFFSTLSDTASELRVVQRVMRGSRLDPARPNKINNAFVWSSDGDCSRALQLLKDADPTFSARVRVLSTNYDLQASLEARVAMQEQQTRLQTNIDVVCISADELWMRRKEQCRIVTQRLGRLLNRQSNNQEERSCAHWIHNQRQILSKSPDCFRYKILDAETTTWWTWGSKRKLLKVIRKTFQENLVMCREWVQHHENRLPTQKSKDGEERRLGVWIQNMRQKHKKDNADGDDCSNLHPEYIALKAESWWTWGSKRESSKVTKKTVKKTFDENIVLCREWVQRHDNRLPTAASKDDEERRLGKWIQTMRQKHKKDNANLDDRSNRDPEFIALKAESWWTWGSKRESKVTRKTFNENIVLCREWVQRHDNRLPTAASKDDEEKRLGKWIQAMRQKHKNADFDDRSNLDQQIIALKAESWWTWESKRGSTGHTGPTASGSGKRKREETTDDKDK